jgi:hypothetical protein
VPWHAHDYTSQGLASALKHAEGIPDRCISAVAAPSRLVANMFHALLPRGFARGLVRLPAAKSSNGGRTLRASSRRVSGGLRPRLLRRRWAGVQAQGGGFGIDSSIRPHPQMQDPANRQGSWRKEDRTPPQPHSSIPPAQDLPRCGVLGAVRSLTWLRNLTQSYPTRDRSGES